MSQASALEQEMIALVNAERAKVGVDPLTFDDNLNSAAENHSSWMLENDIFNHTGVDGTQPEDRAVNAGYVLEGRSAVGENIGWQSTRGEPGLSDDIVQVHEGLMNSPSHRAAILNPLFTEIGIGVEDGDFFIDGEEWDSVMVTQNFGTTEAVDSEPALPEEDVTPVEPETEETIATGEEEPETPEEPAPEDGEEIVTEDDETVIAAGDETTENNEDEIVDAEMETVEEELPEDATVEDTSPDPMDTTDNLIFTGFDDGAFDWGIWLNLDSLDDLLSGNGNNNGNGNTGDGINGQGNGFGNSGTGVNGTGNGNGNSDWWNDQFELTDAVLEQSMPNTPDDVNNDWSLEGVDFASLGEMPELALSFDDCFMI